MIVDMVDVVTTLQFVEQVESLSAELSITKHQAIQMIATAQADPDQEPPTSLRVLFTDGSELEIVIGDNDHE